MKVYCLSSDAAKPCFVVSFKEQLVMLDCGLSAQSLLHFLPLPPAPAPRLADLPPYAPPHQHDPKLYAELRQVNGRVLVASEPEWGPPLDSVVPFEQLDAILISNYSCMLALPFVTEGTGFKGHVYATEPTLQIGRFYLEELLAWVSAAGSGARAAKRWKEVAHTLPPPLCDAVRVRSWRRLPPAAAVRAALARVTVLHYEQVTQLFGALTATPVSSGYCLGSANWVLRTPHEKLAYVGGSSTLTTHPRPINQHALKNADVLLLAALTQTPAHNPDHALGDLCVAAASTLRGGGAVLVPVFAAGLLYDLLECLSAHLEAAGLCNVPLFVVGPAADASLAYSNILAEWLSGGKQARVYLPEEPFPHAALARAGRLRHAANIHDDALAVEFRQPCVVFCGHPSLRFGPAVHFMQLWATSPQHAVIFTEPDFPYQDALAPYQPLQMKAHYCPIDTALNYAQATKLVRELRARELLLPEQYRQLSVPATLLRRGSVAVPALRRRFVRATLPASLASKLAARDLPPLRAAPLAAELRVRDSTLELATAPALGGVTPVPRVAWGGVDSEALTRALAAGGLGGGARGAAGAGGGGAGGGAGGSPAGSYTLHLARHDTLLHVERTATHVFCEGDERARQKARDAVLSCLSTL